MAIRPTVVSGSSRTVSRTVVAYGVRVCVRADDPRLLQLLVSRLPPRSRRVRARSVNRTYELRTRGRGVTVHADAALLAEGRLAPALDRFEADVKLHVAEMAPRLVFVHAGVVGWRGRAIVVPGRTWNGKSTLVAALVRAGASYYSDEYAVLDSHGRVHPYPRPLALRDRRTGRQRPHSVASMGGRSGRRPLTIGAIAVAPYRKGSTWNPASLTSGQGVLALLRHTVPARRDPARALSVLRKAVSGAIVLDGTRGEAREMARALLDGVGLERPRQSVSFRPVRRAPG